MAKQFRSIQPDSIMVLEIIGTHLEDRQEVYVTAVEEYADEDSTLCVVEVEHANGFKRELRTYGRQSTNFSDPDSKSPSMKFRLDFAA